MSLRRVVSLVFVLALGATVTACGSAADAGGSAGSKLGALAPALPGGDVLAQGTVIEQGGDAQLCLGAIQESYPPQCAGLPLSDWTWDGVDGSETSGEVTWGAYAVRGTYDGSMLTVTQPPIMLALYDPIAAEDPTGGRKGAGTEADLRALQDELPERLGAEYLDSTPIDGWLWVNVVWDDGTLQDAANAEFGEDVVVIRSALRSFD